MDAAVAALALITTVAVALGWRRRIAPAIGAGLGVAVLLLGGIVDGAALSAAANTLWRPVTTITAIMIMTTCAEALGLFDRLAALIEPTTRGPVRRAFTAVFVLAVVTSTVLSNDGAISILTPTVIALLRMVYPRRHPKFVTAFAFAVFAGAGVAPLATSNPMNLVVAERAGIGWNTYAATMIPVAAIGWLATYAALRWAFRAVLADDNPALGAGPGPQPPLGAAALIVIGVLVVVLGAYPVVAFLDGPLWMVATTGATICAIAAIASGVSPRRIAAGPAWEIVPFLGAIVVIATGLANVGVVEALRTVYRDSPAPLATVGLVAALGSAAIDNHAMGLLNALALTAGADRPLIFASLIGGNLGPRMTPIGSLAGLLWLAALRRDGVVIPIRTFLTIGLIITVPTLVATLLVLAALTGG